MVTLRQAAQQAIKALEQAIEFAPSLVERKCEKAITALRQTLEAEQQDEPFGYFKAEPFGWTDCAETDEGAVALYERPHQPAQQPLNVSEEFAAFKTWFDAWFIGDGDIVREIPTPSDTTYDQYVNQYTLGLGAWMAAKHNVTSKEHK